MKVSKLIIDVKVVGSLAVTTMDITYHNDYPRLLEGELNFPLAEGQSVSRFAMELNGKLREGVCVEKAKGRVVFEDVVRNKIDPALLEQTKGNSFKARIYPIPANGDKRIVLAYEENISETEEGSVYRLPLQFKDTISLFKLTVQVFSDYKLLKTPNNELKDIDFQKSGPGYASAVEYKNYIADKQFEFALQSSGSQKNVLIETINSKTYFNINLNTIGETKPRRLPKTICIFWDASSSMANRDVERELELLTKYIKAVGSCEITLVPFANAILETKKYNIIYGNILLLKNDLSHTIYDGGTQLGAIDLNNFNADEYLIFTDGISNFGEKEIKLSDKPVFLINSMQNAEHSYMNYVAQKTNGAYINLLKLSDEQAMGAILNIPFSFISAEYSVGEIEQTYPSMPQAVYGSFILTGLMKSEKRK